jgi:hypothetical protein
MPLFGQLGKLEITDRISCIVSSLASFMSKPPAKKQKVILTVKDTSIAKKSPIIPKKLSILEAIDAAREVDFNDGDDSFEHICPQHSADGDGDDVLKDDLDGSQGSDEGDDNELLDEDEGKDNEDDKSDGPTKSVAEIALTPPPTDKKK